MMRNDPISYVWSDSFVNTMKSNNEKIFGQCTVDCENIKLAFLKQLVGSCVRVEDRLSSGVIEDFKFEMDGLFEKQILKWVGLINYVDEISNFLEINYSHVQPTFDASKFYNFLHSITLEEVIAKFTTNLAIFTELIYYRQFFRRTSNKRMSFTVSLLYKKLTVFSLVWAEKEKETKTSAASKKLAGVLVSVKLYSIVLSLPQTTQRKMFGFFDLFDNRGSETRYEKIIVNDQHYVGLHDFLYKNVIIQMYDYENSVSKYIPLKDFATSYSIEEVGDLIYDEKSSVFEDTTVYEQLHSQDNGATPLSEESLFKDCSKWFTDLNRSQQKELIPLMSLHNGGIDEVNMFRFDERWFVNGGCESVRSRMDESSIW